MPVTIISEHEALSSFAQAYKIGKNADGETAFNNIPREERPPRKLFNDIFSRIVRGEAVAAKAEVVVDYLAEELKREEAREAKHVRMAKLVSGLKAKAAGAGR